MEEVWKKIEGAMQYLISNKGVVKSFMRDPKGMILKDRINSRGYYYTGIQMDSGKHKSAQIHVLVASHFVTGKNPGLVVNHKDGIKANNNADNLEWITQSENMKHAFRVGLATTKKGSDCNLSKLKEEDIPKIFDLRNNGASYTKISKQFNVSRSAIIQIIHGKLWAHLKLTALPVTYTYKKEEILHGTYGKYRKGCRCDPCKRANADRMASYKNSRKNAPITQPV